MPGDDSSKPSPLDTPSRKFNQQRFLTGTFTGLRFVKVNQMGWGIFEAQFSNGTLEIAVAPLYSSGRFAGESCRLQ
jgi:hypothetical protein